MTREVYKLEFITPCFCAGADNAVAELRASSVRGQLRWWFRALGGTYDEEKALFGGVAHKKGDDNLQSRIVVRTRLVHENADWEKPSFTANDPESYVWYYAKVSGLDSKAPKYEKDQGGPRWRNDVFLAPGTKWELHVLYRDTASAENERFRKALTCFLALGGIGLRVTRGLGAFVCKAVPYNADVKTILLDARFAVEERFTCQQITKDTYAKIGELVKGAREKTGWKNNDAGDTPSPMGSSLSLRQTSAVYFRMAGIGERLQLVIFEAPHDRVLGEVSRKDVLVGRSPSAIMPPARRGAPGRR